MRTESLNSEYLVLSDGPGPYPGVVVVHEAFGLNDNIRGICLRFAEEVYAALGVDLFEGRSHALCMAPSAPDPGPPSGQRCPGPDAGSAAGPMA